MCLLCLLLTLLTESNNKKVSIFFVILLENQLFIYEHQF